MYGTVARDKRMKRSDSQGQVGAAPGEALESRCFKIERLAAGVGQTTGSVASAVHSALADGDGHLPIAIGCKGCGTRDSFSNIRGRNNKSVDECLQQESVSRRSVSEHSLRTPDRVKVEGEARQDTDRTRSATRQEGEQPQLAEKASPGQGRARQSAVGSPPSPYSKK